MFNEFFYYMTPNMKQQDVMPFHLFNGELRRRNAGEEIPHKWYEGGHF